MTARDAESWPFEPVVREIVALLARGEYGAIERRTGGRRLSADELRTAVREYGRRIVAPPPEAGPSLVVVALSGPRPPPWSVDVTLWTAEEGRSDLTLQLTVREAPGGGHDVEVDDLHVL